MNEEIYHVKAKLHVDTSELDAAEAKVDLLTEKLKGVADLIADLTSTDITVNADIIPVEENAEGNDSILEAVDANFPMGADEALDLMEKNLDKEHLTKVMRGETSATAEERLFAAVQLHQLSNRNTGKR